MNFGIEFLKKDTIANFDDLHMEIYQNLKLPSMDDFKVIHENYEIRNEIKGIEKKYFNNYTKALLNYFELFYLLKIDGFYSKSYNNKHVSEKQINWIKEEILFFFHKIDTFLPITDSKSFTELNVILDIVFSMIDRGIKYDEVAYVYESFYQLKSRIFEKNLMNEYFDIDYKFYNSLNIVENNYTPFSQSNNNKTNYSFAVYEKFETINYNKEEK
jgi:hypothetical protein